MESFLLMGKEIKIIKGDITEIEADAIVNAANSSLMGGGGVDGAIHKKGGPQILTECKAYRAENPPLPTGEAIMTTAGKLSAKAVIHTVGPIWQGGGGGEPLQLANAYKNSMLLADEQAYMSIAFPAISTGIYGYPLNLAAQVVKKVILETAVQLKSIKTIIFVLFNSDQYRSYVNLFGKISDQEEGEEV